MGTVNVGFSTVNVGISSFPLEKILVTSQTGMSWQMPKPCWLFNIIRVVTSYSCPCVEIVAYPTMLPLGHPKRVFVANFFISFGLKK